MNNFISKDYLKLNEDLHAQEELFGKRTHSDGTSTCLDKALTSMHSHSICNTLLDYGTGKGLLIDRLRQELPESIEINGYDPAIKKYSQRPNKIYDIVTCFDVLEHVEPKFLDQVLLDIMSLTKAFCFLVVDLQPSIKKLPDGRNAHIMLAPHEWWSMKVNHIFPHFISSTLFFKDRPQKVMFTASSSSKYLPAMYKFNSMMNIHRFALEA